MSLAEPRVEVFSAIRGEPLLERGLDALNTASRLPTPCNGAGYIQAVLDNDEFARAGQKILLLAALDGNDLVGFLALRRAPVRVGRLTEDVVEFLITHENDRPRMAARPADEERCARAFFRHLLENERGWKVLDFVNLPGGSPLLLPAGRRPGGFRVRVIEGLPSAVLPVERHADLGAWYRSLGREFRKDVERQGRRFLGAGRVELVGCRDPRARLPLLEVYLDLESRSWKSRERIGWHPARVGKRRALCAPDQPMQLSFHFLLLDGAPVAATVVGLHQDVLYGVETCYDAAFGKLGPGHFMFLMAVREAFVRRVATLNMHADFAYYKGKWGARIEGTHRLQLFRLGSAHWLKSHLGDWRRRLRLRTTEEVRFNRYKRQAENEGAEPVKMPVGGQASPAAGVAARPALDAERELAHEDARHARRGGNRRGTPVGRRARRGSSVQGDAREGLGQCDRFDRS